MNHKNKQWGKSAKFFTRDLTGGKPATCHPLGCSYIETWQDNQGDVKGLCVHVNCKKGEQIFLFGETTNSSFSAKKVEPLMIYSLHVLFFFLVKKDGYYLHQQKEGSILALLWRNFKTKHAFIQQMSCVVNDSTKAIYFEPIACPNWRASDQLRSKLQWINKGGKMFTDCKGKVKRGENSKRVVAGFTLALPWHAQWFLPNGISPKKILDLVSKL